MEVDMMDIKQELVLKRPLKTDHCYKNTNSPTTTIVALSVEGSGLSTTTTGQPVSEDFEVERIVDYIIDAKGHDWYRVKWKNWDESTNTWEPPENLHQCRDVLLEFFLNRRKEYYDKSSQLTEKGKKLAVPPDPRSFDIQLDEYFNHHPQISTKELNDCLIKYGSNFPDIRASEFSKSLSNAIFGELALTEVKKLRELLAKIAIKKRKQQVNTELQAWCISLNAVANGRPIIQVENNVDFATKPENFEYVNLSSFRESIKMQEHGSGCLCAVDCEQNKKACCPAFYGSEYAYNRMSRIIVPPGTPIYECNDYCSCGPLCHNRVVQDGIQCLYGIEYCIFRTTNGTGWGLKTKKKIPRGRFVCMIVGQIISSEVAQFRQNSEDQNTGKFLFNLDTCENTSPYVIDFSKRGNVSHFINHSCEPNCAIYPLYVNFRDVNMPKLALFSTEDIPDNTEITYSYFDVEQVRKDSKAYKNNHYPSNYQPCLCGAETCVRYAVFAN